MGKLKLCSIGSMLMGIALSLALVTSSPLRAQYPLLPAESNGNANYEWRPDLGGWRDKQTNLIWGYNHSLVSSTSSTYGGALIVARGYSQALLKAAQDRLARAQLQEERALLETDPVREQGRLDLAATFRADAAACSIAGSQAAAFSNWRVPTLTEFRSAYSKGMFSQGTSSFNFDAAPFTGYQPINRVFYWTSEPAVRNGTRATIFHPGDGGSGLTSVNSGLHVLVVRSGP